MHHFKRAAHSPVRKIVAVKVNYFSNINMSFPLILKACFVAMTPASSCQELLCISVLPGRPQISRSQASHATEWNDLNVTARLFGFISGDQGAWHLGSAIHMFIWPLYFKGGESK